LAVILGKEVERSCLPGHVLLFGGDAAWVNGNLRQVVGGIPGIAILLLLLSGVVLAGLIYGVTYLCTMIAERTSVGLMLSGGALAGYSGSI
jgi:hypothetical protein